MDGHEMITRICRVAFTARSLDLYKIQAQNEDERVQLCATSFSVMLQDWSKIMEAMGALIHKLAYMSKYEQYGNMAIRLEGFAKELIYMNVIFTFISIPSHS